MVILNKIYTKTGDDGTTALGNGERIAKSSKRVSAYGSVDELNSFIGLARSFIESDKLKELDKILATIQNDLFDLGADLCIPDKDKNADSLKIVKSYVKNLEKEIDKLNSQLEPLRSFILPGGTKVSAYVHIARTIARRCEREMIELRQIEEAEISKEAVQYINRLSDFLFVAARYVNLKSDFDDILWIPGNNYEE
ncbi:MAG: ATP:cob(I)alamin adenosyltransferase [Rhodobiaceae bacterium]|nr:ATP:cob(I)alamin adenosyltransferase [Rhodobiaceae bacterium]MEC7087797.1 cob(I)yrinic acid a,c-diamide adenosyltransferase [Pseudomonadota bacterium]MEC7090926.1 cob(I)yrinic acid a,c-diamide adenosyltransferase [Pseudomonadota bacterium]MEC8287886.1 cob(I)yrinic acid a,c-diamide adenosyltransferase [Pseudomonadota bacterium]MEC8315998.1 cob(I)yrinic acid a,c-diamide adenosyltransferase [Pseudomonadota bacterium]